MGTIRRSASDLRFLRVLTPELRTSVDEVRYESSLPFAENSHAIARALSV
jgi:hypothetical protein